jgi:hypothetical protein
MDNTNEDSVSADAMKALLILKEAIMNLVKSSGTSVVATATFYSMLNDEFCRKTEFVLNSFIKDVR